MKTFWKELTISIIAASLLFQGCDTQASSNVCDQRNFKACIHNTFPPGSDYRKLKQLLIEQGFTQEIDEPMGDNSNFIFDWYHPISLKSGRVVVAGEYDKQYKIVELIRP